MRPHVRRPDPSPFEPPAAPVLPRRSTLYALTLRAGIRIPELALVTGVCAQTLTAWADKRPGVVDALIQAYATGATRLTPAQRDELAARRRRSKLLPHQQAEAARIRRRRWLAKLTPEARAKHTQWRQYRANAEAMKRHRAELAYQGAFGIGPMPRKLADWFHTRAKKYQRLGASTTADDIRALLASQGRRCAYCGLALHDPWIVRRDPDALPEPDNLLAVCWYHGPRKGHAPDSAYRFDNGIPTVTPWDPL